LYHPGLKPCQACIAAIKAFLECSASEVEELMHVGTEMLFAAALQPDNTFQQNLELAIGHGAWAYYSAAEACILGDGTLYPSSFASSIHSVIAPRTLESASSGVSPSDRHPGRSGTVARKPPPSAALKGSIRTG
jgi:hypothetical protein